VKGYGGEGISKRQPKITRRVKKSAVAETA
jgi:hypothetical protein